MSDAQSAEGRGDRHRLSPFMSPLGAWAYGMGTAIGWGSFVVTGNQLLLQAGPLGSVAGLLLGTLAMFVIAHNYAYLMERYPSAGGGYAYARYALGHDWGFLQAWFLILCYFAVFWANATSLPLFAHIFFGDTFRVGYLYTIFGYDVYAGEALLTIGAITVMGLLCMRDRRLLERVMIGLVLLFTLGIVGCTLGALILRGTTSYSFAPLLLGDRSALSQIMGAALMTPWAFIGFESVSHSAEEFAFERQKVHRILFVVVGVTAALYALLIVLSVTAYPARYASWFAYLSDLDNLSGIEALPPFYAVSSYMGDAGVVVLSLVLLSLVLTSLIGNIVALSRLLAALGYDRVASKRLTDLNSKGSPYNAVLLITISSLIIPFVGRTAIGWIVDITTIGAIIVYGIMSLSTYAAARSASDTREMRTGIAGIVIMIAFGVITLLPTLFSEEGLASETYFLLVIWSILGFVYCRGILRAARQSQFGKTLIVWGFLLTIVLLSATVWMQRSNQFTMDAAIGDMSRHIEIRSEEQHAYIHDLLTQANKTNVNNSIVVIGMLVVTLAIMMGDYHYLRKRQEQSDLELGVAWELAYRDPLTGVKSATAFTEQEAKVDELIIRGDAPPFAVVVCDVNGLKAIYDTQGHSAGDAYIKEACAIICRHFSHSPVFRIGGDEFAVVLEEGDYRNRAQIMSALNQEIEDNIGTPRAVLSAGMAEYDSDADRDFRAVFERADIRMYQRKGVLKTMGVTTRG